MAPLKRAMVV